MSGIVSPVSLMFHGIPISSKPYARDGQTDERTGCNTLSPLLWPLGGAATMLLSTYELLPRDAL